MQNSKINIKHLLDKISEDASRNENFLHLTANEAQMSNTARTFLSSKINERYYMGGGDSSSIVDFGDLTALGFSSIENLLTLAKKAVNEMLGAADSNLNVLSGVHAMMSAILATTEPGDAVMSVPTEFGGHFATIGIINKIGRKHFFADFDFDNLRFDINKIKETVIKNNIQVIYLDVSYYLNPHNLRELREAVGPNVIIIYDASHTMGLIMGKQFQNPFLEGADIITANTHKTLPGPHKGMIVFKDKDLASKANKIINSSFYSTPHLIHLIPLAITLLELEEFGQEYAKQIISNSNAMAEAFVKLGYEVRKSNTGRYSENHQIHVFIDKMGNYLDLYRNLINNNISTNFQGRELANGRWFIRIGTQEITRRGMLEDDMNVVAKLIDRALKGEDIKKEVILFNNKFPNIYYSFDNLLAN